MLLCNQIPIRSHGHSRMLTTYPSGAPPGFHLPAKPTGATLTGVDFFRRSAELAEKYRRPGTTIAYSIQTNGTLLDDECGEFLAATNSWPVSASTDRVQRRWRI